MTDNIIASIIGAVSVLIGIRMGAWQSERQERKKVREQLKSDLVAELYILIQYRKIAFEKVTFTGIGSKIIDKLSEYTRLDEKNPERNKIKEQRDLTFNQVEQIRVEHIPVNEKMIDIESRIFKLLSLIKKHYGDLIYRKLMSLVIPQIEASNNHDLLDSYEMMDFEEIIEQQQNRPKMYRAWCKQLDITRSNLTNEIEKVF